MTGIGRTPSLSRWREFFGASSAEQAAVEVAAGAAELEAALGQGLSRRSAVATALSADGLLQNLEGDGDDERVVEEAQDAVQQDDAPDAKTQHLGV